MRGPRGGLGRRQRLEDSLAGAHLFDRGGRRGGIRRPTRPYQRHRMRRRVDALEWQLTCLAARGRSHMSRDQHRESVARAFDEQPTPPGKRRLLLHLGRRIRHHAVRDHRIVYLDGPGRLLTEQSERDVLGVGAGLDEHRVIARIDPFEIETRVGVDCRVEPDQSARGVRRDPVQVPVAFLDLVPRPEHRLE